MSDVRTLTRFWLPAVGIGLSIMQPLVAAAAPTKVIRSFTDDKNGSGPKGGLTRDVDGSFIGTTTADNGGASTVFRIQPDGTLKTLHTFNSDDGYAPEANVTLDPKGIIYGTTRLGGTSPCASCGVVFKLRPSGTYAAIFRFADDGRSGLNPQSPLLRDSKGNLYGTTNFGGANNQGVVFKLAPNGVETILHAFAGAEGSRPQNAGVVMDAKGNLYGTTYFGGDFNRGTVFKIAPNKRYTVMHSFKGTPDGDSPNAGVIIGKDGNLYGTTQFGGSSSVGAVFKVTPSGQEAVIASFNGTNGRYPLAPLTIGGNGALFGTTSSAVTSCVCGVVFKVTTGGQIFVLHTFTGKPDGREPQAGVTFGTNGDLYGTTLFGGTNDKGAVFQIAQ